MKKVIFKEDKSMSPSRRKYLHRHFGCYGIVTETEDRIEVRINQNKVYKNSERAFNLQGMDPEANKPVYYIFEDIFLGETTVIHGENANFEFKRCRFGSRVKIDDAISILMENNKHEYFHNPFCENVFELIADEITITNNNFVNTSFAKKFEEPKYNVVFVAEQLTLIDSHVCSEFSGQIEIVANDLVMRRSTINGPKIYLSSDNIDASETVIVASRKVEIDNKNCGLTSMVKSPRVVYNGLTLKSRSEILEIDKEKAELLMFRMKLLQKLNDIRNNCEEEKQREIERLEEDFNTRSVGRVLRKAK